MVHEGLDEACTCMILEPSKDLKTNMYEKVMLDSSKPAAIQFTLEPLQQSAR